MWFEKTCRFNVQTIGLGTVSKFIKNPQATPYNKRSDAFRCQIAADFCSLGDDGAGNT